MNRSSRHQSMFLMEMIVAILFFSLVSAVCLRIFTGARQMSRGTGNLHMAVNQAGNAAELLKIGIDSVDQRDGQLTSQAARDSSDSAGAKNEIFPEILFEEFADARKPDDLTSPGTVTISYDRNWTPCPPQKAVYRMRIDGSESQGLLLYHIAVDDVNGDETIYSLDLKFHRPIRPVPDSE